jgi:predicted Zn-dependent protease
VTPRSRDELLGAADAVLTHATGDGAEAVAVASEVELTRYAASIIHQNVAESGLRLRARVLADSRVGVAEVRGEAAGSAARVAAAAEDARRISAREDVAPLPAPDGGDDTPVAFSEATAAASPEARADMVGAVTRLAAAQGLRAYGFVSTQTTGTALVNTRGLRRAATSTQASMIALVRGENGSGYAARHSPDVESIDVEGLATEAVDTCMRNQNAQAVEPGLYEVVLSPYAVADLLGHLSWVGFGALAKQEHRSFMRLGEQLMSGTVTIADDCRDPQLFPYPFDDEGVSTRVVNLVERGVCASFVYDTPTALRDGVESTGHSLPQPNTWGPFPRHMHMAAGDRTVDELVGAVKRGLYVTRFWYVRDVHPLRTIITGMTRDGTFLIENGKLGAPVNDLRFTQSIVDALNDVRGVSRDRLLELEEGESGVLSPWLHLGHFAFTS